MHQNNIYGMTKYWKNLWSFSIRLDLACVPRYWTVTAFKPGLLELEMSQVFLLEKLTESSNWVNIGSLAKMSWTVT